jgi:hypothetical protein
VRKAKEKVWRFGHQTSFVWQSTTSLPVYVFAFIIRKYKDITGKNLCQQDFQDFFNRILVTYPRHTVRNKTPARRKQNAPAQALNPPLQPQYLAGTICRQKTTRFLRR